MTSERSEGTRQRILAEAMRLFGENGYAATPIASIEQAAGLSPGSGGLYKRFRSKAQMLAEGVNWQLETGHDLHRQMGEDEAPEGTLGEQLALMVAEGLRRLDLERDLNRLVVRDLRQFPDLMDKVREREMHRIATGLAQWLSRQNRSGVDRDWVAIATVLTGSVANYWVLRDAFGAHPSGVSEPEFVAATDMVAVLLTGGGEPT